MKYKYSVILPIYQVGEYLSKCLDSLIPQVNDRVQIILIDDGSTDGSARICDAAAEANENIVVFHQENGGVSSARNKGLDIAEGEYILWVDPDDYVEPFWFEEISRCIEIHHPDVLLFDAYQIENGIKEPQVYGRTAGPVETEVVCRDVLQDVRMKSHLHTKVAKRELYNHLQFREDLRVLEDFMLVPDVLMQAKSVFYLDKILYNYVQRSDSLLHTQDLQKSFESVKVAEQRQDRMPEVYYMDAGVAVAVQAFGYCRNVHLANAYSENRENYEYCRHILKKYLIYIFKTVDYGLAWKLKYVSVVLGFYSLLIKTKYSGDTGRGRLR